MNHDFIDSTGGDRYDNNGVKCTDINGVMDYGSRPAVDRFSTCSTQDFRDYYNRVLQTNNEFCLNCGKIQSFVNNSLKKKDYYEKIIRLYNEEIVIRFQLTQIPRPLNLQLKIHLPVRIY